MLNCSCLTIPRARGQEDFPRDPHQGRRISHRDPHGAGGFPTGTPIQGRTPMQDSTHLQRERGLAVVAPVVLERGTA